MPKLEANGAWRQAPILPIRLPVTALPEGTTSCLGALRCAVLQVLPNGWCGHWLNWRRGIGLNAAPENIRVPHALKGLSTIASAFAGNQCNQSMGSGLSIYIVFNEACKS